MPTKHHLVQFLLHPGRCQPSTTLSSLYSTQAHANQAHPSPIYTQLTTVVSFWQKNVHNTG